MAASLKKDNMFRGMFLMEDLFDPIRSRARRVIRLTGLSDTINALGEANVWVNANQAGTYAGIPLHNITCTPINNTDARVQLDYADEPNYILSVVPTQDDETVWGVGTYPVPWIQSQSSYSGGQPSGTQLNGSSDLTKENLQPFPYTWHVPVVTIAMPALLSSNANSTEASRLQKINGDAVTAGGVSYAAKQLLYTGASVGLKKSGKFPTYYNFLARQDGWEKQIATWTAATPTWSATTVDMFDSATFTGFFPSS